MKLLEDIIDSLASGERVEEIYIGPFDTMVKSKGWGLSTTFRDPCVGMGQASVREAGKLLHRPASELATLALSPRLLEASLGMAVINSLMEVDEARLKEANAFELIEEKGRDKEVAVVGRFPFLPRLEKSVKQLYLLHKEPHQMKEAMSQAEEILPRAAVVAITGSSFITHTTQRLLELCLGAYTIVLGPTTPLTPLLFDYGVDAICGSLVEDSQKVLSYVWQGASFKQIEGLRLVTLFKEQE